MLAVSMALASPSHPAIAGSDYLFIDSFDPFPGFQIRLPEITVPPGQTGTFAYYARAPIAHSIGVNRWSSTMTPAAHHVIAYATYTSAWAPLEIFPPGTLQQGSCGVDALGSNRVGWLYAAHQLTQELMLPNTDGTGQPLAMEIESGQPLCVEIYIPSSDVPVTASAVVRADGLAANQGYMKTATYVTHNTNIFIQSGSTTTLQRTCATPGGAKFWWVSTRTHRFAQFSRVLDGASPLVKNSDWQDPQAATFPPPAFHAFGSGGLTYECTWFNDSGFALTFGDNEDTNEVCMGIGYFFPAQHPAICINNIGPQ
jgi:hypothetical protein